ncbi:hypothetical protein Tsubulata_034570 [Turnera subulata]|uniref:Uncharacterized protein n=1 Tax=Turnera subulata TaxID=218843 RepID=A0A9Q0F940_9ROSI|nr:hypothetical protein Tsubulata_034570 [Turnera subulata]
MPSGAITKPPAAPLLPFTPKSPALSLSIKGKMDSHGDMGLLGDHFDNSLIGRFKEDGNESRSGSDNVEGASGDDQDAGEDQRPRKKYHRHTSHQIQELESFFKECPHPDEKQRMELSRRLGLESKQIKFWFQNRRTQMKTQLERHENIILRQENDKLRAENELLKQNVTDPVCNNCGGPVMPGPVSIEQQQLRIENARLKDELGRVCALANKFLGRPIASSASPIPSFASNSRLDLAVGRNGFDSLSHMDAPLPIGLDYDDGIVMPLVKPMSGALGNNLTYDGSLNLALTAMNELIKMAEIHGPVWIKTLEGGKETLNQEEYMRMFTPCIGRKPIGFVTEATRETGIVLANSLTLVEMFMNVNQWVEAFQGVIAGASTLDILSSGVNGSRSGAVQVMVAEFQLVSPLVPVRQVKFLRFCKQHAEGVWVVVDVSIDANLDSSNPHGMTTCRRLPSGCLIQDMPNGCCKVTWVEHSEYDNSLVHQLYRQVLSSGRGFGAQRWFATLQRYYECMASLLSPTISGEEQTGLTLAGKKSMLKLAQRMVDSFCSGVCASSVRNWEKLLVGNVGEDVRILTRKNSNNPGELDGIVLSASTSFWLPVTRQRLFDFLRDEQNRSQWDILSDGGLMQEVVRVAKSQGRWSGNCVSLLRSAAGGASANENSKFVLQETWNDSSGSLLVYSPVDLPSMTVVTGGGNSTYVTLSPSGFAILPDDSFCNGGGSNDSGGTFIKRDCSDGSEGGGCLVTVGLQMLVNNVPTAKLTMESVESVHSVISCIIQRIKAAFHLHS